MADFDIRFRIILRKHLTVLAWWSIVNALGGLIALLILRGGYYFWIMSGIWGIINFAVAIGVLNHTFYRKFRQGSSYERFVV